MNPRPTGPKPVALPNCATPRYEVEKATATEINYSDRLKKWCPDPESNQRHGDFQSPALPTELSEHIRMKLVGHQGLEPGTCRL